MVCLGVCAYYSHPLKDRCLYLYEYLLFIFIYAVLHDDRTKKNSWHYSKKNNEITREDKIAKTDAADKENVINTADKVVKKVTIIGADCVIQGDIKLDGNIEVYGQIKGNVTSGTFKVSVMDNGSIEGDVIAEHVSINGRLAGVCHARNIEILQKGVLNGVCRAEVFSINTGGVFVGQSEPYVKKVNDLNKEKKSHQDINPVGENNEIKIIKK
ncbi:hypothetical protein AYY16_09325 [Morganella psychrotolerans]|uniref:bactofilin family protein n=1 Tax=Morganella psychrotolerans TaxID=368603 RepID=UPI000800BAC3|nr:polymer-forming cytoskeletal protein [Morganella psychrotolerans]OBU05453.1 hypothetical protein AYY16_09325 [Morganella psychrotolerans]